MIVVGAKGFAIQLHDALYRLNECNDIVFYDDITPDAGNRFLDCYTILRSEEEVRRYWSGTTDRRFALGIGGPGARRLLFNKFSAWGGVPYSVISNHAIIGPLRTSIAEGVSILANSVIESNVQIGKGSLINLNTLVTHDSVVGEFCEISPGVQICGRCSIGNEVTIGAGATILPDIRIGDNSIIGAGAVVTRHVDKGVMVTGIPAKPVIPGSKQNT